MTKRYTQDAPDALSDEILDTISGGPLEDHIGNFNLKNAAADGRKSLTQNENIAPWRLD